jgi:hypothetical protein
MQPVEEPCSILKAAGATLARKNETCFILRHLSIILLFINILASLRWKGSSKLFLEKACDLLEG